MTQHRFAVLSLLAACAVARAAGPLPRDSGNTYGTLDNGLKYVIRHNANPPGRVAMYLHVRTGALNESDAQNGLAHFIEHMAFNGSTHFPPGTLVPMLSNLGMTFGADTNAHTNLWETVYKLNLPDTRADHIDLACKIFADYAGGLTLTDDQIDSERAIILEELRTRLGAGQRLGRQQSRDLYADTRLATHDIIGDAEQIKSFTAATFRDYYDRWYRPENMTLIVVGDVKPEDVVPVATQWLGKLAARTPATPPQRAGLKPTTRPQAFVYTDPEQVAASVTLSTQLPGEPPVTTAEQYRKSVLRGIGLGVVDRRYRNLIMSGKAAVRAAGVEVDPFFDEVVTAGAEGRGEPLEWRAVLRTVIGEIDRANENGFSDDEIKLIQTSLLAGARQAVVTEATRDSSSVVNEIAGAIGLDRPMLSAAQQLDLLTRSMQGITAADVASEFKAMFTTANYNYVVTLPDKVPGLTAPTPADVLQTAEAAWAEQTQRATTRAASQGLVAKLPEPGRVEARGYDADLKLATLTFANGVVMHHKFNDYKKDQVLVKLTLPGGELEETAGNRGVSSLASVILNRPATGRMTSAEIADLFTGKNVGLGGGFTRDTLALAIQGTNADLPAGFELVHALMTDPRLEAASVADWKKGQQQALKAQAYDASAQLRKAAADTLFGGDPRFAPLTVANVDQLTRDAAEAWFKRTVASAAIEVNVVGDISEADATRLVAAYVGSLPARRNGFDALDRLRTLDRAAGPYRTTVSFESSTPKAIAVAGFVGCEDNDPDRRPLTLAADILTNRMVDQLREKEQLVYSIQASNQPGRGVPNTGMFTAGSVTDPTNAAKLVDRILQMTADFAKTGPTDAELATAKRQVLLGMKTSMNDPAWWLQQAGELRYRKRPLEDLKALPGVFETFTTQQVRDVVAKYMTPERLVGFVISPKSAGPASQPATRPE